MYLFINDNSKLQTSCLIQVWFIIRLHCIFQVVPCTYLPLTFGEISKITLWFDEFSSCDTTQHNHHVVQIIHVCLCDFLLIPSHFWWWSCWSCNQLQQRYLCCRCWENSSFGHVFCTLVSTIIWSKLDETKKIKSFSKWHEVGPLLKLQP